MKKLLVIGLLLPFLGIGQTKNVLNSTRVFAKQDRIPDLEKAIAAHAQKYHTGDWKWRVWAIQSGPDAGGYMITEGPNSWEQIDGRNDISSEHMQDWEKNVAPLTEGQGSASFFEFKPDLGTVELTDYADKIIINHMIARPGKIGNVSDLIKKLKPVWLAGKESVAVYQAVASGDPCYIAVTRLKGGFKELSEGYRKPLPERYNEVNGQGSFDAYLKDYADAVEKRWSEILVYKPGLSSK
ncbi:MAG TPA: hypothetical protein VL727_13065 [Puia sp.]|jgi:hypothetical protein|nr:hypothetical protein [Puia sp.]